MRAEVFARLGVRVRLFHPGPGSRLEVLHALIPHMRANSDLISLFVLVLIWAFLA